MQATLTRRDGVPELWHEGRRMPEVRAPQCPRCFLHDVEIVSQQLSYKRNAKNGELKGLPKLESTTTIYRCDECLRDFSITVDGD